MKDKQIPHPEIKRAVLFQTALFFLKSTFHKKVRYAHLLAFARYSTPVKVLNLAQNVYERKRKKTILRSKPFLVNSEPTNRCNFKCPFCPTGQGGSRTGGFASIETYEKVFREIGKYVYLVTIHGWGEPLLHKSLPELIGLAHRNRIFTVVTTNGSLLTPELSRRIVESKLDYLVLSVDGASEGSYQKYRINGSYATALNNLKSLVAIKKELGSSTPFIEWQFLVFRHNEKEMNAAKQLAYSVGVDNIVFLPAYTEDERFDASDKKYHLPKGSPLSKRSDCKHLWSTLAFHWNGNVVPCCYDYQGEMPLGNILEEPLHRIWNNRKFEGSRQLLTRGMISGSDDLYCFPCVQNMQTDGQTRAVPPDR